MSKDLFLKTLYAICTACAIVACGGGDDNDDGTGGGNAATIDDDRYNANRNATSTQPLLARLEYPKVKGGMSVVVTHATAEYGENYAVEWDCEKKAQRWTCYEMYAANSVTNGSRKGWWGDNDPFQEDTSLPEEYRSTLADYRGSGFNRGHICPSADRLCSKEANEQTFFLSNMQPQYYNFNARLWEKMEEQVRKWNVSTVRDTLFVCKGGTIDNEDGILQRTQSGLIVPRYFFMAILCKKNGTGYNGYRAIAFWAEHLNVDHSGDDLRTYAISIDELEQRTGIDFFCNLPDGTEAKVESIMSVYSWRW